MAPPPPPPPRSKDRQHQLQHRARSTSPREIPFYILVFRELLLRHNANQIRFEPMSSIIAKQLGPRVDSAPYQQQQQQVANQPGETRASPSTSTSTSDKSQPSESSSRRNRSVSRSQQNQTSASLQPSGGNGNPPSDGSPTATEISASQSKLAANGEAIKDLIARINHLENQNTTSKVYHSGRWPQSVGSQPQDEVTRPSLVSDNNNQSRQVSYSLPAVRDPTDNRANGFKDSAPSIGQTPNAVMGNSNSLPLDARARNFQAMVQPAMSANSQSMKHSNGMADNSSNKPPNSRSPVKHYDKTSLAKTIAEQMPASFKTMGPGFSGKPEKGLRTEKSQLTNVPSDYEHIFHAPSNIIDSERDQDTKKKEEKKREDKKRRRSKKEGDKKKSSIKKK